MSRRSARRHRRRIAAGTGFRYADAMPPRARAHAELTREVEDGPSGPRVGAFFDLDRTLLAGFSAAAFIREGVLTGNMSALEFVRTMLTAARFRLGHVGFSGLIAGTVGPLIGRLESEYLEEAERIFAEHLAAD